MMGWMESKPADYPKWLFDALQLSLQSDKEPLSRNAGGMISDAFNNAEKLPASVGEVETLRAIAGAPESFVEAAAKRVDFDIWPKGSGSQL